MARISGYRCIRCGGEHPTTIRIDSRGCPLCREEAPANLQPIYVDGEDLSEPGAGDILSNTLWRYASFLPCSSAHVISLGEGQTPLLSAPRLAETLGVARLHIKDEGRNPTWSHKDRFSTVAVSAAVAQEATVLLTASSGNAGASLAAYAAKAGLRCFVVTFAGAASPILSQIRAYGGRVLSMARKDDRWALLKRLADRPGWFITSPYQHPVVGSHPLGIEGYKTIAYEIADQLDGQVPDWCVLPVCYGDALAGLSSGFRDLLRRGKIARLPRLVAAEVHGSLTAALAKGLDRIEEQPAAYQSIALSIGTTRSAYQAVKALRDTQGCAVRVSDQDLLEMQRRLAASEGLFVELASAAPLVAIQHLRKRRVIAAHDRVVAVVTASGLKDVDISAASAGCSAPFENVEQALQWIGRQSETERVVSAH